MMAIAKDPANRFQSADAFRAALSSVEVSQLPASNTTAVTPTPKPSGATTLVDTPHTPRIAPTPAPRTPAPVPTPTPARVGTPAPTTVPITSPGVPAPATAGAVPPPMARPSSSRGVWLAIGVLLTVGVLLAAGTYIPKHMGTHAADPKQAMFPASGSGATQDASTAGTSDSTATPATPSTPTVNLQSDQGSLKVDSDGSVSIDSPQGSMHVDAKTGSVSMSGKPSTKAKQNLASGNPTPSRADAPVDAGPPTGPSPEEIAKTEDEADKLNVRAETATQSVETLRKQQQAAGYNLRADIASSEQRMQLYMSKGNSALKAQDLKNAQKYFDMAEAEVTKIEKFLGH
jgi:hypothetical protein